MNTARSRTLLLRHEVPHHNEPPHVGNPKA